jgi:hypothetical protein
MKMLLGRFNSKVSREDILKLTIGNENLREISYDNESNKLCHIEKSYCQKYDMSTS